MSNDAPLQLRAIYMPPGGNRPHTPPPMAQHYEMVLFGRVLLFASDGIRTLHSQPAKKASTTEPNFLVKGGWGEGWYTSPGNLLSKGCCGAGQDSFWLGGGG